jgi:hypothetical protein
MNRDLYLAVLSHLLHSRIQPRLVPFAIGRSAAEHDAFMQAERPVVPEFDTDGLDPKARPVRRTRHFADRVARRIHGNRGFERKPALERPRLL